MKKLLLLVVVGILVASNPLFAENDDKGSMKGSMKGSDYELMPLADFPNWILNQIHSAHVHGKPGLIKVQIGDQLCERLGVTLNTHCVTAKNSA